MWATDEEYLASQSAEDPCNHVLRQDKSQAGPRLLKGPWGQDLRLEIGQQRGRAGAPSGSGLCSFLDALLCAPCSCLSFSVSPAPAWAGCGEGRVSEGGSGDPRTEGGICCGHRGSRLRL